jgi:hypothetical protein
MISNTHEEQVPYIATTGASECVFPASSYVGLLTKINNGNNLKRQNSKDSTHTNTHKYDPSHCLGKPFREPINSLLLCRRRMAHLNLILRIHPDCKPMFRARKDDTFVIISFLL